MTIPEKAPRMQSAKPSLGAVLTGVIGLLLVLRPTEGAQALVMLMGASLFLDGALNLSVALCAVKVVRHQQPDVIETDDYEIEGERKERGRCAGGVPPSLFFCGVDEKR